MKKAFIKTIGVLAIVAIVAGLVACGNNEDINETEAWETATAPETQPPETSAPTEAAVEVETEPETEAVPKKQYTLEKWQVGLEEVFPQLEKFAYPPAPEIGETKMINYYATDEDTSDGMLEVWDIELKSVALPEWGISKISVDPNLFPEDESSIVKITEDQIKRYPAFDSEIKDYGEFPEGWTHPMINKTLYTEEMGCDRNQCFDDSILFPGAFSRKTVDSCFRVWRCTGELDILDEAVDNIQMLNEYYPYSMNGWLIQTNGKYVASIDGYDYAFINILEPYEVDLIKDNKENKYARKGVVLLRIKDGLCEGMLYMHESDKVNYMCNYIYLHSLVYDGELTDITGGNLCTGYYEPQ